MKRALLVVAALLFAAGTAAAQEGYVGSENCRQCHADQFPSYEQSPHGIKSDQRSPAASQGCESCHGPGGAHASAGGGRGVGGIMALGKKSLLKAEQRNAPCLECHSGGRLALWHGNIHDLRHVACSDCHSIHNGYRKSLNAKTETEVCATCHQDIRAQLLKSSHHPIREGKMTCSDCHNPHGTIGDNLVSANHMNEKCYECHAEKRGPFLWEHQPATENCMTCHQPHGSSHDRLLVQKRPYLCQTCHSNSRHPGTLYGLNQAQIVEGGTVFNLSGNRLYDRACQNCHSQMHGSNHPSGKSLMR